MVIRMYIIVGLGNPTKEYTATRHNIGFDAITRLADEYNITLIRRNIRQSAEQAI